MNTSNTESFLGTGEEPLVPPGSDERLMAILSHILAIVPGIGILGPLIIYLAKKDSPFVAHHARESLNFQITVIIAYIVAVLTMILLIGFFLFWLIGIANTILVIVASIRANDGKLYRYPFSTRLV
jgi:uncharacterized Tic20 family protein